MSAPDEANPLFTSLIMLVPRRGVGGGHIRSEAKGGSLCGVEKRLPYNDHEDGVAEDGIGFRKWFAINEPWLCRKCVKAYAALRLLDGANQEEQA